MSEKRSAKDRFLGLIEKDPNTNCWTWKGAKNEGGYGRFRDGAKTVVAHRFSLMAFRGLEPKPGEVVLHHYDKPDCVNPDHLSFGSNQENLLDSHRKGRRTLGKASRLEQYIRHFVPGVTDMQVDEVMKILNLSRERQ